MQSHTIAPGAPGSSLMTSVYGTMNDKSKWKENVDRINNSGISPALGLALCSIFDGFMADREENLDKPMVGIHEILLIRLVRNDTLPDWVQALIDLLYESDLDYESAKLAHQAMLSHWLARSAEVIASGLENFTD